jgi:hypothetical protein
MAYYKNLSKYFGKYSTVNISWSNRVWYIIPTIRVSYSEFMCGIDFFFLGLSVVFTRHLRRGKEIIDAYKQGLNE